MCAAFPDYELQALPTHHFIPVFVAVKRISKQILRHFLTGVGIWILRYTPETKELL